MEEYCQELQIGISPGSRGSSGTADVKQENVTRCQVVEYIRDLARPLSHKDKTQSKGRRSFPRKVLVHLFRREPAVGDAALGYAIMMWMV